MRDVAVAAVADVGTTGLADVVWENARQEPDAVQFVRPDPDLRAWPPGAGGATTAGPPGAGTTSARAAAPDAAGGDVPVTCRQFRDEVVALARGLVAAGVAAGDRVGLMSRTRYEWTLVDYALWAVGAVTVPLYDTSSPEQTAWILADSQAVACVVETAGHAATLAGLRDDLPALRHAWQIDAGDLVRLVERGGGVDPDAVAARRRAVGGDDLATIVYTSGTTGRPKGCALSHRNLLLDVGNAVAVLPELFRPGASTVLFLPLAHAFARLVQVGMVQVRATMTHSSDPTRVLDQLRRHRPTFVLAVPRVFEKLHDRARRQAAERRQERLFGLAERVAVRYSRALDRAAGPGRALRLAHLLCDVAVYRRLRAALGGRCRLAIVGGAPLGVESTHFFRGVGVTVLEGYGLTETSPALAVNLPSAMRIGTVGRPLPGVRLAVAADGEVLARGPMVFRGYWNDPAATRATFTPDGWLRTGDLGGLDSDGYLRITGRKKDIIVTASGKNVAPAPIEDSIRAHPLVSQVVLVGDGRPYVAALVAVDPQACGGWLARRRRPDVPVAGLRDDPELRAELQTAVDRANRSVSRAEAVKTFRVLPRELTEAAGELTPTLKVRREAVLDRYAADVAALYPGR
ncbi:long-chain fatty acid--CoA ligase [Micromonospora sp. WMMD882]|uniref:AMP-dependent synthetase/ligase n=1 Tax=Micromonospora sp. WMMD882 TaxID=3015151 RepID=UPI00248C97F3|nr:long-chain fatty acid--CoA ligase [Micromonospora sp. WMMD882]WBB79929.1 long-chain fatty acid--CoA ligase [Micromonospora sp. WMMD882]